MVDFPINTGIRKIASNSIFTVVSKDADEEWFDEDIIVLLSGGNVLGTLVVDFAFSIPTVVEYTLNSGANWVKFNNGATVDGGQSRFIDVTTGNQVNFRAVFGANLIRCIVSSVP